MREELAAAIALEDAKAAKKKKRKKKVQGFNPATRKTQSAPMAGWDEVANPYKTRI